MVQLISICNKKKKILIENNVSGRWTRELIMEIPANFKTMIYEKS